MARPSREDLSRACAGFAYRRLDLDLLVTIGRQSSEDVARAAWATWCNQYKLDDIDIHAMKLLPRAVARMEAIGTDRDSLKKHHGIVKYLWLKGQVIADGARAAAEKLRARDIQTIAIKGIAMRSLGIASAVERPMMDADLVLKEPHEIQAARRVLAEWGWKVGPALAHATTLTKNHAELDLHAFCLRQDQSFPVHEWAHRGQIAESFRVVDPTALMIITCLHGMCDGSGALWLLDADALAASGLVNWEAVSYFAKSRALTLTFESALRRVLGVPKECMLALEEHPASHIEALELRHWSVAGDRLGSRAAALMQRLRLVHPVIEPERVHRHDLEPGLRWDSRWTAEWSNGEIE